MFVLIHDRQGAPTVETVLLIGQTWRCPNRSVEIRKTVLSISGVSLVRDLGEIAFSNEPFRLSGSQGCNCVQITSLSSPLASSWTSRITDSPSSVQNSQRPLSLAIWITPMKENLIFSHNSIVALFEKFKFFDLWFKKKVIHVKEETEPFLYLSWLWNCRNKKLQC